MTPADNINTLQKKLGKVQGIPPEELRFVCDSTALGSDPRTTLDDYGVQLGAVMDLTHGTSVAVRTPDGRVITLDYEPEAVASLKQRVQTFDGRVPEPGVCCSMGESSTTSIPSPTTSCPRTAWWTWCRA